MQKDVCTMKRVRTRDSKVVRNRLSKWPAVPTGAMVKSCPVLPQKAMFGSMVLQQ